MRILIVSIMVLVYVLFELQRLRPFGAKDIEWHYYQLTRQELVKQLLAARRKKIFLVLLSAFVSWILILYFFMPLCLSVL